VKGRDWYVVICVPIGLGDLMLRIRMVDVFNSKCVC